MIPNQPAPIPPAAFNPRRGTLVTRDYLQKLIKKGVGSGERESYRPWLKIRSVPSKGTSRTVPGVRVARVHHCLSNSEYMFLVLVEFNQDIVDIREQFPLIDYDETYSIALQKNIRPALYVGTDVPFVFTADFMLSFARPGNEPSLVAISLKYREEINAASVDKRKRIFEKQEIEKEYWARRGVRSTLCFYEDLPHTKIKNLIILRDYANLPLSVASDKNLNKIIGFFEALADPEGIENIPLRSLIRTVSQNVYMEYKTVKELFFYLIWHKKIFIDLDLYQLNLSKPVVGLRVLSSSSHSDRSSSNGQISN
ncbi:TnsA endonuclease N-terminal domain-containing protein [Pseudomonas aeruginosa]|uniref:TnsA endonuclease N-terminal domain-containing protein n=1 Tax=Pseudomonas aeruginosa TaxID=287 RepID=UPI000F5288C4|nr:TnsA endonuclease N-terminal domain-containing protein [Pseudomonas aeruginosa]MCS7968414.1 TnsA endonuclease N-terminal domain-containing protein [Pseudomonas aeruginosa]MCS8136900.1 TnsA endonuclease N-terminal domain-containing protein [Pseudomonas aeruginosa]MCS8179095.1 TnsA endonuclease N-terminal domain-containing protein [Pseudomonas aeruginosa]MCS8191330.1 TnsA endonuclease N-terminal domain-containing protein [Pseudomonas aeruginosa]MCT0921012.1 TnsA endonuclease N-terminal domain